MFKFKRTPIFSSSFRTLVFFFFFEFERPQGVYNLRPLSVIAYQIIFVIAHLSTKELRERRSVQIMRKDGELFARLSNSKYVRLFF